jgi:hypothetical protein
MPQVKYTADGLPYYDATDQQSVPYFAQPNGPMLPAPGNPAQPGEGWNQGVRDTLHGMTIGPVQDAAKALQGGMTDDEAQNFAFGAALGLIPMSRGLKPVQKGIRAYHGSPHDFDRFDMSKIGTGEGAQAYGHGLYFADNPEVAASYKQALSRRNIDVSVDGTPVKSWGSTIDDMQAKDWQFAKLLDEYGRVGGPIENYVRDASNWYRGNKPMEDALARFQDRVKSTHTPGRMYEVNINAHPDQFLDWDKPLNSQAAAAGIAQNPAGKWLLEQGNATGKEGYHYVTGNLSKDPVAATNALREAGIPGIKYLDQGSRTAGEGSRNYVVFDDKLISIIKKYGWAAIAPMLGLTAENLPIPKAQAPQFQ